MRLLFLRAICAVIFLSAISASGQAPVFQASPNPVDFGVDAVGRGQPFPTESFTITNTGNAPMTVGPPTVLGDSADFCFVGDAGGCGAPLPIGTLAPGASSSFCCSMRFFSQAAGTRTAQVTFTTNAAGSPNQVVITGVGIGPGDFGLAAPSSSSSATPQVRQRIIY